ncbi:MAG: hypothetical protein R6U27_05980 [Desulfobacterales bacterium]
MIQEVVTPRYLATSAPEYPSSRTATHNNVLRAFITAFRHASDLPAPQTTRRGFKSTRLPQVPAGALVEALFKVFQRINILLAYDGFIAVLEQMPVSAMTSVESYHIPCEKFAHAFG